MPVKPLSELRDGEKGRIVRIGSGGGFRQRFPEKHGEKGRIARIGGGGDFHQRFPEKHGEKGRIARIGGGGGLRRRLLDMGLVPGSEIKMERVAPLGDPIEIKVKGCNLALRKEEAAYIQVEVT